MNYPIVYTKKSKVLNKTTLALVVEKPDVWKIYYPDNIILEGKDTGWPIGVFNDPKSGVAFLPGINMYNILGESFDVFTSPAEVLIQDIIKEVNSLTNKEIEEAAKKQSKVK